MRRAGGGVVALLLVATLLVTGSPSAPAAPTQSTPAIELVAQSPIPTPDAVVDVSVRLPGVPADGSLLATIRGRVRSRSELALSMEGDSLRANVFSIVVPLGTLPPDGDGVRTFSVSLDPAAGGVALSAGVYPLEIVARDAADASLATLVTHLVVPPSGEGSPPLNVAAIADVSAPPVPRAETPGGELDEDAVAALAELVDAIDAEEGGVTNLATQPETLLALAASGDAGTAVVDDLRALAEAGDPVIAQPYVPVSIDALRDADLSREILHQVGRGAQVVEEQLGVAPVDDTWLAGDDLGASGLALLEQIPVPHAVVPATLVEPLPDGVIALSLAQPFLLDPPRDQQAQGTGTVDALEVDPLVVERLGADGEPALVANRTVAELATLWFEQPGIPRAAVLPLSRDLPPGTAAALLEGLAGSPVFETVPLGEAFAAASPLLDPAGNRVHRPLTPQATEAFGDGAAARVREARRSLTSAQSMVVDDPSITAVAADQLLLGTTDAFTPAARDAETLAVQASVDALLGSVTGPVTFTLTLTDREGTIPLTLHNDSGLPLAVAVHLRSAKLDFPDGEEMEVVLEEPVTRLDIPVRSRASGALSLTITVTTPDGAERLVRSRYTVRSTAVAGAGLVLSIGAGLFLLVWWARHWRTTRRNRRLVAAHAHPATTTEPRG